VTFASGEGGPCEESGGYGERIGYGGEGVEWFVNSFIEIVGSGRESVTSRHPLKD